MSSSFPPVDHAAWRALVEQDLKGASFESTLQAVLPEGITLRPLYTAEDTAGWTYPAALERSARVAVAALVPTERNAVVDALEGGADGVWLGGGPGAVDALRGVESRLRWLRLDVTDDDVLAHLAPRLSAEADVQLALDPMGAQARGDAGNPEEFIGVATRWHVQAPARWRTVCVSAEPYHLAGAHAVQELALSMATAVQYLQWMENGGIALAAAVDRVGFQYCVGRDVLVEMCKLRAARLLWARITEACGVAPAVMRMHAVGSVRTLTVQDPFVNALRGTTQAFAAFTGGADAVTLLPHDTLAPAGTELGVRLARNTLLVLREEAHLGAVRDPARGSYAMEALTRALARQAWALFQQVEARGGMLAALSSGWVREMIDAVAQRRAEAVATRREPITGVSEYAPPPVRTSGKRVAVAPGVGLPVRRDAEPFENLRDRAAALKPPPSVHLVRLGTGAEASARMAFARNLFAAGGFGVDSAADAGTWNGARDVEDAVAAFGASGCSVACLCGPDARYADHAAGAARALKAAGARVVFQAGRPRDEAAARDAGIDGWIHLGMDAVDFLSSALDRLTR